MLRPNSRMKVIEFWLLMNKRAIMDRFAAAFPALRTAFPEDMRQIKTGSTIVGARPRFKDLEQLRSVIYLLVLDGEQWVGRQFAVNSWNHIYQVKNRYTIQPPLLLVNELVVYALKASWPYNEFYLISTDRFLAIELGQQNDGQKK